MTFQTRGPTRLDPAFSWTSDRPQLSRRAREVKKGGDDLKPRSPPWARPTAALTNTSCSVL